MSWLEFDDVGIELGANRRRATPVEFGATNLISSDPIKHSNKSAIGSLIIEPRCGNWTEDAASTHAANVRKPLRPGTPCGSEPTEFTSFREYVVQFQNDLNMRFRSGRPVPNLAAGEGADAPGADHAVGEDSEDSGQKAFNYRTEPFWTRLCYWPALSLTGGANWPPSPQCPRPTATATRQFDVTNALHNTQIGGRDPVTPIFSAQAGRPVRFRVLHSGGHARNDVFMVHGHIWQEMPYQTDPPLNFVSFPDQPASNVIGINTKSPWHGAQWGHGPSNHFDVVIKQAGGAFNIPGDYLYRTFQSYQFDGGMWGIFRVNPRIREPGQPAEPYEP